MTVVTVAAITAVAAFFYAFVWPSIKGSITGNIHCSSAYGCVCSGDSCTCKGYYGDDGEQVSQEITCDNNSSTTN